VDASSLFMLKPPIMLIVFAGTIPSVVWISLSLLHPQPQAIVSVFTEVLVVLVSLKVLLPPQHLLAFALQLPPVFPLRSNSPLQLTRPTVFALLTPPAPAFNTSLVRPLPLLTAHALC